MKLEKQLGLGRNTSGSIDEKNKKQDQSCLFVKIWNIVKIIIWIICVYIIIRSFLFSPSDGQSPVENSKILGEKSVIINNIPPSTGIVLNPIQRNETQDFESLLKLAISLQMLLASLKTDEEEVGVQRKEEIHEHPKPPKAEKLIKNQVDNLAIRETKKENLVNHTTTFGKETTDLNIGKHFEKGKTTDATIFQNFVQEDFGEKYFERNKLHINNNKRSGRFNNKKR